MTEDRVRDQRGVSRLPSHEIGAHLGRERFWRLILGLALGLVLLALAFRGVDLRQVLDGVQQADPTWVGLALLTVLLTTAVKISRWRGLFPGPESLSYLSLARALLVGQLMNALLPARLGEVARSYVLGRDEGVSKATVLGTVATEKAFDVLFLLIAAGLTALLSSLPAWLHGSLAGLVGLGMVLFITAVFVPQRSILGLGQRLARRLPSGLVARLIQVLEHGLFGMESLRDARLAAAACAWSVAVWTLATGTNLVLFRACDLDLSVGAALLLLTLLQVGMTPPSVPGRLGIFHAITVVSLAAFGVDRPAALAYATMLHAIVYGPQIILGALALVLPTGPREAAT